LDKIVRRRLRESTIGFFGKRSEVPDEDKVVELAETRDFVEFGLEPEFIGRLPVRVYCKPLTVDDLFGILKHSEGSIIRQYQQDFAAYGIQAEFADSGLKRIAEFAAEEKTGARGLMTICERVLREFKFELPSTNVKHFIVDDELVNKPQESLNKLIQEQKEKDKSGAGDMVAQFVSQYSKEYDLQLSFTKSAFKSWFLRQRQVEKPWLIYAEKSLRIINLV
jgi:ATP-dependent protease Clp ATPase subunit